MEMIFGDSSGHDDHGDPAYEPALTDHEFFIEIMTDRIQEQIDKSHHHLEIMERDRRGCCRLTGAPLYATLKAWELMWHAAMADTHNARGHHLVSIVNQYHEERKQQLRANFRSLNLPTEALPLFLL